MKQWHLADKYNRMYINLEDNKKASMPRYYKDRIYTPEQRSEIGGYLKGEMEKREYELHQKCIADPMLYAQLEASRQAAFERAKSKQYQGDKL